MRSQSSGSDPARYSLRDIDLSIPIRTCSFEPMRGPPSRRAQPLKLPISENRRKPNLSDILCALCATCVPALRKLDSIDLELESEVILAVEFLADRFKFARDQVAVVGH